MESDVGRNGVLKNERRATKIGLEGYDSTLLSGGVIRKLGDGKGSVSTLTNATASATRVLVEN